MSFRFSMWGAKEKNYEENICSFPFIDDISFNFLYAFLMNEQDNINQNTGTSTGVALRYNALKPKWSLVHFDSLLPMV